MGSGSSDFLQGLYGLANTIIRDTAGIAELRIKSAQLKASSDIDLMNAKFMASLQDPNLDASTIPSLFEQQKSALEDYASNFEFAPARDAVKAMAAKTLPQLYTEGAAIFGRAQLQKSQEDYIQAGTSIDTNLNLTADEWKAQKTNWIDQGETIGWVDKTKLPGLRAQTEASWRTRKISELAQGQGGVQDQLDFISNPAEVEKALGSKFTSDDINPIRTALTSTLMANETAALAQTQTELSKTPNQFVPFAQAQAATNARRDIGEAGKQKILALYQAHNDDAIYTMFRGQINSAVSVNQLDSILSDLKNTNDGRYVVDGVNYEQWNGPKQEERRTELEKLIEYRKNELQGPKGSGSAPTDVIDVRNTLSKNLAILGSTGSVTLTDPRTGLNRTITIKSQNDFNSVVTDFANSSVKAADGNYYPIFESGDDIKKSQGLYNLKSNDALSYVADQAKTMVAGKDKNGKPIPLPGKYDEKYINEALYQISEFSKTPEGKKLDGPALKEKFDLFLVKPLVADRLNNLSVGAIGFLPGDIKRDVANVDPAEAMTQYLSQLLPMFGGDMGRLDEHLKSQGVDVKTPGGLKGYLDELQKQFTAKAQTDLAGGGQQVYSNFDAQKGRFVFTVSRSASRIKEDAIAGARSEPVATQYTPYVFSPEEAARYNKDHPGNKVQPNVEWWVIADTAHDTWVPLQPVGVKK